MTDYNKNALSWVKLWGSQKALHHAYHTHVEEFNHAREEVQFLIKTIRYSTHPEVVQLFILYDAVEADYEKTIPSNKQQLPLDRYNTA
jgi:hypothetical protein